jgi:hypothetical protein
MRFRLKKIGKPARKGRSDGAFAKFWLENGKKQPGGWRQSCFADVRMKNLNLKKKTKGFLRRNPVVVMGAGFRCMAFRDAAGRLRNFWNEKILPLPVHFLDPEV